MDASIAVSSRRGHRLVSAVLGTVLAGAAALAAAQIVAVPAALLSHAEGSVAIAPKGDNEWTDVKPRRALRRGDRVWTDKGSRAEVQAGAHALRLDGQTQVALETMGEGTGAQVSLLRGSLAVAVPRLAAGENVEVGTPNLALRAKVPGDYRVDVDAQQGTTRVSVMGGAVAVYGEHGEVQDIAAGQRFTFQGRSLAKVPTPAFTAVDEFDRWIVARGRTPAPAAPQAAPAVHPDVIARMHREQEAQRMAQARRELEEQKQALVRQAAQAQRQPRAAAPVQAPAAPTVAAPRPVEAAPRIVQVPRAQPNAEEERQAQVRRAQEQQRAAQARRLDDERRNAQARRAEEERRSAQVRRAEQDKRLAAVKRAEEEKRTQQARRAQEQQRLAAARRAEEERRAALARKAEQEKQRVATARRLQQVQAQGEARRGEHLARLQEQARREEQASREQRARREEQARREEEARREDQARREDETRREAWDRRQRALAEQQRRDQDVWLRTQQPMPVPPARPVPQGVPGRRIS
jgi:hypothetical protein